MRSRAYTGWTTAEKARIARDYPTTDTATLARTMKRTREAIESEAARLGVKKIRRTLSRKKQTAQQTRATGERWCMSCSMYRRAENGKEVVVSAGRGRKKKQFRCAVCLQGRRLFTGGNDASET